MLLSKVTFESLLLQNNTEDYKFLKESLLVKLNDEDPTVVVAVLQLKQVRKQIPRQCALIE